MEKLRWRRKGKEGGRARAVRTSALVCLPQELYLSMALWPLELRQENHEGVPAGASTLCARWGLHTVS